MKEKTLIYILILFLMVSIIAIPAIFGSSDKSDQVETDKKKHITKPADNQIIPNDKVETKDEPEEIELMKEIRGILLVNKTYGLPSDYYPEEDPVALEHLEKMIKAAKDEINKELIAFSGFRSYNYQNNLYDNEVENYGEEDASKYCAKPGHSEHQTGLAFDIGGDMDHWLEESFGETEEGIWLRENAHRFGFILRYPMGKTFVTGFAYEPWHFRYVGIEHSKYIYENELTLEEYLLDF